MSLLSKMNGSIVNEGSKSKIDEKNVNFMLIKLCDLGYFEKFNFVNRLGLRNDMFVLSESIEKNDNEENELRRLKNGIDVSCSFGSKSGSSFKNWIKKNGFEDYELLVNDNKSVKVIKK